MNRASVQISQNCRENFLILRSKSRTIIISMMNDQRYVTTFLHDYPPGRGVVEGMRHNIPNPHQQTGPTCWYATTINMLKYFMDTNDFDQYVELSSGEHEREVLGKIKLGSRLPAILNVFTANKRPQVPFQFVQIPGNQCTWENIVNALHENGPVYISLTHHPNINDSHYWDATALESLTCENSVHVQYQIPYEVGGTPHAMLCVGYLVREFDEIGGEHAPEEYKQRFQGYAQDHATGLTEELLLLDPNRPNTGDKNNVIIIDFHQIMMRNNINLVIHATHSQDFGILPTY